MNVIKIEENGTPFRQCWRANQEVRMRKYRYVTRRRSTRLIVGRETRRRLRTRDLSNTAIEPTRFPTSLLSVRSMMTRSVLMPLTRFYLAIRFLFASRFSTYPSRGYARTRSLDLLLGLQNSLRFLVRDFPIYTTLSNEKRSETKDYFRISNTTWIITHGQLYIIKKISSLSRIISALRSIAITLDIIVR